MNEYIRTSTSLLCSSCMNKYPLRSHTYHIQCIAISPEKNFLANALTYVHMLLHTRIWPTIIIIIAIIFIGNHDHVYLLFV